MNFLDVWGRIKKETPITSLNDMAEVIGTSQPNISRQKKEGSFPPGWAYAVGKKYGLLTEWLMTGEGPKRLEDSQEIDKTSGLIEKWLQSVRKKEGNVDRIVREMTNSFPEFNRWCDEEKKNQGAGPDSSLPQEKIA